MSRKGPFRVTRNSTARADFYREIHFLNGRNGHAQPHRIYPASTGIGADGLGMMMSAIALLTDRDDIRAVPLENPRQTAAYDYAAVYSPS